MFSFLFIITLTLYTVYLGTESSRQQKWGSEFIKLLLGLFADGNLKVEL